MSRYITFYQISIVDTSRDYLRSVQATEVSNKAPCFGDKCLSQRRGACIYVCKFKPNPFDYFQPTENLPFKLYSY